MRRCLVLLLLLACSDAPPVGSIGAPCPNDANCRPGLKCIQGKCAEAPPNRDAGQPVDMGVPPVDMGVVDMGMPPEDAGLIDMGPVCPIPPELSRIQTQVFNVHCNQAACHGQSAAGGIMLTLPLADLHTALLGPTQDTAAPERQLVVPGDPASSRLYVIISTMNPPGNGTEMPPGQLLEACDQQTIRDWIANGALEN